MENFKYSKVFPSEDDANDTDSYDAEAMKVLIQKYERDLKVNPRFVIPFAPAIFEKTVVACEQIAKEFSGKIKAEIDYSHFAATIELWCCYVEFQRGEFLGTLHDISKYANSIMFTPLKSGDLHTEIWMPYFVSARKLDEID